MNRIPRVSCALLLLWAASGLTQEPVKGRSISLDEALARTLTSSPGLIAAGYEVAVWEGRMAQARLARNPELTLNVEDFAGSGDYRGVDSTESTLSLAWVFERGVRGRRVDAASAGVSLAALEADLVRVDVAAETARWFLRVLENQSLLDISTESVQLAEDTVAAVRRRVDAGRAPEADLHRAGANLGVAREDRRDIEAELSASRLRLAAQWGDTAPDFARADADLLELPDPAPYAELRARIEQNPDLVRYLSQQRVDEAEVRLAEAQRRQPWIARLGVRRMEATNDHALVASIAIPLAVRDANQGNIATARAVAERTKARSSAARSRVETMLAVMHDGLERSRSRAVTLREDIVPALETALGETRRAYERGLYSFFEWNAVQAELIDARRRLLAAGVESRQYAIEIERLTGAHISELETRP